MSMSICKWKFTGVQNKNWWTNFGAFEHLWNTFWIHCTAGLFRNIEIRALVVVKHHQFHQKSWDIIGRPRDFELQLTCKPYAWLPVYDVDRSAPNWTCNEDMINGVVCGRIRKDCSSTVGGILLIYTDLYSYIMRLRQVQITQFGSRMGNEHLREIWPTECAPWLVPMHIATTYAFRSIRSIRKVWSNGPHWSAWRYDETWGKPQWNPKTRTPAIVAAQNPIWSQTVTCCFLSAKRTVYIPKICPKPGCVIQPGDSHTHTYVCFICFICDTFNIQPSTVYI